MRGIPDVPRQVVALSRVNVVTKVVEESVAAPAKTSLNKRVSDVETSDFVTCSYSD